MEIINRSVKIQENKSRWRRMMVPIAIAGALLAGTFASINQAAEAINSVPDFAEPPIALVGGSEDDVTTVYADEENKPMQTLNTAEEKTVVGYMKVPSETNIQLGRPMELRLKEPSKAKLESVCSNLFCQKTEESVVVWGNQSDTFGERFVSISPKISDIDPTKVDALFALHPNGGGIFGVGIVSRWYPTETITITGEKDLVALTDVPAWTDRFIASLEGVVLSPRPPEDVIGYYFNPKLGNPAVKWRTNGAGTVPLHDVADKFTLTLHGEKGNKGEVVPVNFEVKIPRVGDGENVQSPPGGLPFVCRCEDCLLPADQSQITLTTPYPFEWFYTYWWGSIPVTVTEQNYTTTCTLDMPYKTEAALGWVSPPEKHQVFLPLVNH